MISQRWKDAILFSVIGFLFLFIQWPVALELVNVWINHGAYQYAWLVMPMLVYLIGWHYRSEILAVKPQPDLTGVVVAVFAGVCWGAATLMNIDVGRQLALILALQSVVVSALGWRAYWSFFPIWGLMFFMVPSGDLLQPVLRLLTVKFIEWFALIAGLPLTVEGFTVALGANRYIVLDECSGLSHFMLALFLGYCFGVLMYRSFGKVVALSVVGALIGLLSNALRVNAIVLIDWLRGSQMPLTSHTHIQWLILLLLLSVFFVVLFKLEADRPAAVEKEIIPGRSGPLRRLMPVAAGLTVLLVAASMQPQIRNSMAPGHDEYNRLLPGRIAGWERGESKLLTSSDLRSQTVAWVAHYRRQDQDLRVQIVDTLVPDAKLSDEWLAPGDSTGWRQRKLEKHNDCDGANCLTMQHVTWDNHKSGQSLHVYHTYAVGQFSVVSKLQMRVINGWYKLTNRYEKPRLVIITFNTTAPPFAEVSALYREIQTALQRP